MRINGNLVFNDDASSEIQNAYVERLGSAPAFVSAHKGRLYFNTNTALYYYNDGSAWVPFATGGNAAALQSEVDAIETSMGSIVNSNGTYNGTAAFAGVPLISDATSLTAALIALANEANGTDTLAELGDVQLGTLSNGQYLKFDSTSGKWKNSTLQLSDVTDVTATAAEVNILSGATLSTTELNFVDGVTSPIQSQLNDKQPIDAGLTALANFNTNGIIVQTANDTYTGRTMVAPVEGIVITNPAGIAGNPSFGLANDLQAVEGLTTSGYAVRTSNDTWTTRTISGASSKIVVTNGDGVSSNTDIDLATVTDSGVGTFKKLTTDIYGRVSGTQNVVASDITGLVSGIYVDVAGDTMSGNLTMSGGSTVKGLPDPVDGTDAVNKNYADALSSGLTWKNAVDLLVNTNVDTAALTGTIDNVSLATGMRLLLTSQTNAFQNGIYTFTSGQPLVRSVDADAFTELNGAAVFVKQGDVYGDSGWTQTAELTSLASGASQTWNQFTGSGTYTWGTGLGNTGNTVYVNLGAGIFEGPSDAVGLDLYAPASSALILSQDGSTRSDPLNTDAKLHLLLKSAGGLTQDVNGLYIPAAGVTNAMMLNSTVTLNADSGSGSISLGGTVVVEGDSVQGINTLAAGNTFTITAADASTASKGVARFDQFDFDVTAGVVKVKDGGIDNVQLVNSTIGFYGDSGGIFAQALGTSFGITGDDAQGVLTVSTVTGVDISVQNATSTLKGVARFSATDFTVTSGEVVAKEKSLNDLGDVNTTNGNQLPGSTLIFDDSSNEYVPAAIYFLYEGSSSTSHTVTHNLGQKYCNVTVVDNTDEVVIPQSITFNSNSTLTVTFTAAISCKVVVMGIQTIFSLPN